MEKKKKKILISFILVISSILVISVIYLISSQPNVKDTQIKDKIVKKETEEKNTKEEKEEVNKKDVDDSSNESSSTDKEDIVNSTDQNNSTSSTNTINNATTSGNTNHNQSNNSNQNSGNSNASNVVVPPSDEGTAETPIPPSNTCLWVNAIGNAGIWETYAEADAWLMNKGQNYLWDGTYTGFDGVYTVCVNGIEKYSINFYIDTENGRYYPASVVR